MTLEGKLDTGTQRIRKVHNTLPHLFSKVELFVGNKLIEKVIHIGHVFSLMFTVLYSKSRGEVICTEFLQSFGIAGKGHMARQQK